MKLTQGCLSSWQIDLVELFTRRAQTHATEEHLSRLESFITTYFLFDRVYVPQNYSHSAFLASLDKNGDIFVADSRISGPMQTNDAGETVLAVNPALDFKNRRHLRSKSSAWLKQHIALSLPKERREDLIEHFKKTAPSPSSWFYKIILSEYQTLFELSVLNEAYSVSFASVSQVYLPDITEIPQFVAFLKRASVKIKGAVSLEDVSGTFSFERSIGGIEGRLSIPPFFKTLLEHEKSAELSVVLPVLRQTYAPVREAFRAVAAALASRQGDELVASEMGGPEIELWNTYVRREFAHPCDAMLHRSGVIAVDLHAGLDEAELQSTFKDRIKAAGPLLRLTPQQSYMSYSRQPGALRSLGIETVIPFERKLFRIGRGYRNKRGVMHAGLGYVVSFPLSVRAQLTQEDLNDPAVRACSDERPPHLYMICTRPRITAHPTVRRREDRFEMEFHFDHGTHIEPERLWISRSGVESVMVDDRTRTRVFLRSHSGEVTSTRASLLFQSAATTAMIEGPPIPPLVPESKFLTQHQLDALRHLDLQVVYIGQSRGTDFGRTAVMRLDHHEKWDLFNRHIAAENPHLEMWIILISQSPLLQLNFALPGPQGRDQDMPEMMRRIRNPFPINHEDRLNFVEAALINYFKPRFNDKFKRGVIPSERHESYERLFLVPVDVATIELETLTTLGCRLYSERVEPRFTHLKSCHFNPTFTLKQLFPQD